MLVGKYGWGSVKSVGAYHERERLCPEGMEVWEVARVHYEPHGHTNSSGQSVVAVSGEEATTR